MNGKYPDADGYEPENVPILDLAPYAVKSKSQNKKLFDLLVANNIPTERSCNADMFICNALGYKTSLATRTSSYIKKNLFVHIPWTTDYKDKVQIEKEKMFLETELYYKGLELLIENI
jgi:pyrrolidone-carboxylate peptidase